MFCTIMVLCREEQVVSEHPSLRDPGAIRCRTYEGTTALLTIHLLTPSHNFCFFSWYESKQERPKVAEESWVKVGGWWTKIFPSLLSGQQQHWLSSSFQTDRKNENPAFSLFHFDSFFCFEYQFFASYSQKSVPLLAQRGLDTCKRCCNTWSLVVMAILGILTLAILGILTFCPSTNGIWIGSFRSCSAALHSFPSWGSKMGDLAAGLRQKTMNHFSLNKSLQWGIHHYMNWALNK